MAMKFVDDLRNLSAMIEITKEIFGILSDLSVNPSTVKKLMVEFWKHPVSNVHTKMPCFQTATFYRTTVRDSTSDSPVICSQMNLSDWRWCPLMLVTTWNLLICLTRLSLPTYSLATAYIFGSGYDYCPAKRSRYIFIALCSLEYTVWPVLSLLDIR